jgi:hypothetical protein
LVALLVGVVAATGGCGDDGSTAATVTTPAQSGLIVPQRSIDRLVLGMTPRRVRQLYGKPDSVQRSAESETGNPISTWRYTGRRIDAMFRNVNTSRFSLAGVFTTSARQRSASGAQVGISERQLTRRLDGLDCGPTDPGQRWCTLGSGRIGQRQTLFVVRKDRVTEVRIFIAFP